MGADNRFRGSLFGGFNRQDVVSYIENYAQMSNEYKASKDALEKKCRELESQLEAANAYNNNVLSEKNKADEDLTGLHERISAQESELSELRESLRAKTEEIELLKEHVAECDETVGLYEKTKERLALLELNASRRAVNIEKAAEEKAADLSKRCFDLIEALKMEYEKICNDTESTTAHIRGEMDRLGIRLVNLSELLSSKAEALSQLDHILNRGLEDPVSERF